MNGSVNRDFLTWSHATFFWYKFKSTPVVSQDDCRITPTGITAICYEWIRLNTCYVSNTSLGVQAVSGCQPCPLGPLSSFLPLVCIVSPICGPLHVTLCTSECMCDARLWGFFFLSYLSCGPVTHHVGSPTHTPPLSHTQRHSYAQHTIRSGSLNRTHRQASIQASLLFELSCLSHVCLWSGCRQLDGGAACSYGWGESSGKHQWAEAWHGHASIHTDTHIYSKYRLAALQGQQKEKRKEKENNNSKKTQSNRVE